MELVPECGYVVWMVWSVTSVAAFGSNIQCVQTQVHIIWKDVAVFCLYTQHEVMCSVCISNVCRYICICVYSSAWCGEEGMFEYNYRSMYVCVYMCAKYLWGYIYEYRWYLVRSVATRVYGGTIQGWRLRL